ncbi:MAG: hypothetical protein IKM59_00910, partial [Oscillospiraceae bacterium]|nr:hypothetical protein [Oscillospiraceae bacterium]
MLLLKKKGIPRKIKAYRNFFGYRPQDRITPGEWFHEENLSSRSFPLLRPRAPRRRINTLPIRGLGSLDGLCFLSGNTFHYKGRTVELPLSAGDKSLLPFGAYMIIRPDMVWVNTVDLSYGNCELSREFTDHVGILWCDREGNPLEGVIDGPTAPENIEQFWLDTSLTPPVLKAHSHDLGQWYPVEHPCIRMNCPGIGELFPKGG